MDIIVCIKQVPDTGSVKIDPKTNTLIREGVPAIVNPFDMNAVEAGLSLRDKYGGKVNVITMGPPQAENALRETIAMGVNNAYLVSDKVFAGADTLATSYTLSKAVQKIGKFDIILCGKQAIDGDTGQVGPELAEILGIPHVANVCKILEMKEDKIIVHRELEDRYEKIAVRLPCLLTVTKEVNEPRMPSLKNTMRAKKTNIPVWNANDIDVDQTKVGLKGSATQVIKIFNPPKKTDKKILQGDVNKIVEELIDELKSQKII